jgi:GTP cyclohydrolase I
VYGRHGCMMARGIRQNSEVVTSVMRGAFLKEGPTRSEFLAFCRDRG